MNWSQARRLLGLARPRIVEAPPTRRRDRTLHPAAREGDSLGVPRAASICVASGKGGTGKSVLSASFARLLALRGRTLVLDADFGVGNAHILHGVDVDATLVDVVAGRSTLREIVRACGPQIDLAPAGSGFPRMSELDPAARLSIATGLRSLEQDYRYLVVDAPAGVSPSTLDLAGASDVVLLVTTPDLTAMTDAYAFLKSLQREPSGMPDVLLVVNRAVDERQAEAVARRFRAVARRFLVVPPLWLGWVPEDGAVGRSVNRRTPVVVGEPTAPASRALRILTVRLLEALGRRTPVGLGRRLLAEG